MVDPNTAGRWLYHALFIALAMFILVIQMVPFGGGARALAGPDLLICLVLVWIQRRPEYLPLLLLGPVLLLADLLLMRPPGLFAMFTLIGAEFIRRRQIGTRDLPFMAEWGIASAVILSIFLGAWLLNALLAAPVILFWVCVLQAIMTALAYPLVVAVSRSVFNIRKRALDGQTIRGA